MSVIYILFFHELLLKFVNKFIRNLLKVLPHKNNTWSDHICHVHFFSVFLFSRCAYFVVNTNKDFDLIYLIYFERPIAFVSRSIGKQLTAIQKNIRPPRMLEMSKWCR